MSHDERLYRERLALQVKRLLERKDADFWSIVRGCAGAYPSDVRDVLMDLGSSHAFITVGTAAQDDTAFSAESSLKVTDSVAELIAGLPPPHPADFDWRFTTRTLHSLRKTIGRRINVSERIALLGAPTLFLEIHKAGLDAVLVDRNQDVIHYLRSLGFSPSRVILGDLFGPVTALDGGFKIAVADPPWYPDYYLAFLQRASEVLVEGGLVFLSLLPWLTRPCAVEDRASVVTTALSSGFDLVECSAGTLDYESPTFERASLSAAGICARQWRSGDLCILRKVKRVVFGDAEKRPGDQPRWRAYKLRGVVVKVRDREDGNGGKFSYRPVVATGSILLSVSRRAPERALIDVWNSENRAFAVTRLAVLRRALERCEQSDISTAVQETSLTFELTAKEEGSLSEILRELAPAEQ